MGPGPARRPGALVAFAALAVLLAGCGGDASKDGGGNGGTDRSSPEGGRPPNLIVVMTDDQTVKSFGPRAMPFSWRLFHDERSAIFESAVAVPPLCCPVRAGFLTGQYPHNHGVLANVPGYADLEDKENVLPAWLGRAGYHTALVGKYLNQYARVGRADPAPGWDSWFAYHLYPAYFDYEISDDGEVSASGSEPDDYSTHRFNDRAVAEIADPDRDRPLFMWLAQNAPHIDSSTLGPCNEEVATPASRADYREFASEPLPRDPSYDEADRSDKPRNISDRDPIADREERIMTLRWRCALASLRAVDEGMEEIVAALEEAGELEETVLVFLSDNGYFFGEHAIGKDKRLPYRASAEVPMAIRVGERVASTAPPSEIEPLVGTFDLTPTLLDYAGAEPCVEGECRPLDGRSLRPLLEEVPDGYPADRAILLELDESEAGSYAFEALRTKRYLYSRLHRDRDGPLPRAGIELYDLEQDPYELENLWTLDRGAVRELQGELDARLDRLAACEGSEERRFSRAEAPGDCE